MSRRQRRQEGAGAVEIIEQAVHLLRRAPVRLLAPYYAGSLPFVLGFLYFWADMSRGADAHRHAGEAALSVSLLFVWMKCWQSSFTGRILADLSGETAEGRSLRKILRLVTVQTFFQPTGLFVLPLALLVTVPFGWVYAFYQNVTVFGDGSGGLRATYRKARAHAGLFPRQNHAALLILLLFGFFVFLNIVAVMYAAPGLLNTFFGVETLFERAGWSLLNTTFLAVAFGLAYLAVDPIVKTVYAIRCFSGEALHSGADLKAELRSLRPSARAAAIIVAVLAVLSTAHFAAAAAGKQAAPAPVAAKTLSPADLDRSITEVIALREFNWRMPRQRPEEREKEPGMIAAFLTSVWNTVTGWLGTVWNWIKDIMEWMAERMARAGPDENARPGGDWMAWVHVLMYVLLSIAASALAIMLLRSRKRLKQAAIDLAAGAASRRPDLTADDVRADELPADGWLDLARKLMDQGDLRLAVRALYLAGLAHLGSQGAVAIAESKSNGEYEQELRRKARSAPHVHAAFAQNRMILERIWYGMHEATDDVVAAFRQNHERIMAFGEKV